MSVPEFIELHDLPRGYISPSASGMVKRCPHQWECKYVLELPARATSPMLLGVAYHEAQEYAGRHQLLRGRRPAVKNIVNYLVDDVLPLRRTKLEQETGQPIEWKKTDTWDKLRRDGTNLVMAYEAVRGKHLRLAAVETWFEFGFEGEPWKIKGRLDARDVNNAVVDFKSTGRRFPLLAAKHSEALKAYQMGSQLDGFPATARELHVAVRMAKGADVQILPAPPCTEEEIQQYLYNEKLVVQTIRAGLFFKVNDIRTCGWCPYLEPCHPDWIIKDAAPPKPVKVAVKKQLRSKRKAPGKRGRGRR